MEYNTLDNVLSELDKRWEMSLKSGSDPTYCLGRIEFRGFNFSIAALWSRYRIETLNGKFIMNSDTRGAIVDFITSQNKQFTELMDVIS
jgi:hypothetical protein